MIKLKVFIPILIMCLFYIHNIANCMVIVNNLNIKFFKNEVKIKDMLLPPEKIEEIQKIPKGNRPNPSTYLSQLYIENHLLQFQDGITIILGMETYLKYVDPNSMIGREDNTCFVMPTYICDELKNNQQDKIEIYEYLLNFPKGYFKQQNGLVKLDIKDISNLNLRIPTGNELGCNEYWIPGGYTISGIPEAISDPIPLQKASITIYYYVIN